MRPCHCESYAFSRVRVQDLVIGFSFLFGFNEFSFLPTTVTATNWVLLTVSPTCFFIVSFVSKVYQDFLQALNVDMVSGAHVCLKYVYLFLSYSFLPAHSSGLQVAQLKDQTRTTMTAVVARCG